MSIRYDRYYIYTVVKINKKMWLAITVVNNNIIIDRVLNILKYVFMGLRG